MKAWKVVGDGLAGLSLGQRLRQLGLPVEIWGDEQSQSPPLGLVHLYAGQTFRRHPLEILAWERAIEFWGTHSRARLWPLLRHIREGDRLDRSFSSVAQGPYAPQKVDSRTYTYAPAFAVAAQAWERDLRLELEPEFGAIHEIPKGWVVATGHRLGQCLPESLLDSSQGVLHRLEGVSSLEQILVAPGLHALPLEPGARIWAGGPQAMTLAEWTGSSWERSESWQGWRCAPRPDRWPLLGWWQGRFYFAGFGSRLLFWLPLALELAVLALLEPPGSIPPELSIERLFRS